MDVVIRHYRPDDLPALRELTVTAFDGVTLEQNVEDALGVLNGRDWKWRKARHVDEDAAADPAGCGLLAASGRTMVPVATALARDVFGNQFYRVAFNPGWRTADVVGLARAIDHEGVFDRLPFLADALIDAGCADAAVLAHCRSAGPHVRGCWVVDLVLGRE